ncbi:MAG: hypothetical protein KF754_01555 [Planctomycetes bacterium]|nr:hypothetical protein [Planctomycetota bacterium]
MRQRTWLAIVALSVLAVACGGGESSGGGGSSGGSSYAITTASLPNGVEGAGYSADILAPASAQAHQWSVLGTLPPGLALDTLTTASSTTLSGTPTAAGSYSFTVSVAVAATSESASRLYTVIITASTIPPGTSVTNVNVSNAVRVAGVKKLGLNLGGQDRWGAAKILKNHLPNPGFEPGVFGTVWLAATGSTSSTFTAALWNNTNGQHAPGFWDGAQWQIAHGAAAGQSGTVSAFTHNGSAYQFSLGGAGTAMAQYDVLYTRRTFAGAQGMHGGVGTVDTASPFSGTQSLRLGAGLNASFVMDTAWRDGDQSSHKLLVVQGNWRVRLKARSANGTEQLIVRLRRDGGAPYNPTFINQTFSVGSSWATHTADANIAAGTDQTPYPWPAATYRPALVFEVITPGGNPGNVWIDEVELLCLDEATNPTAFNDRFVQRLVEYQPGVLRFWAGQLGETLDNQTQPAFLRGTCGYRPDDSSAGTWNYGAHDFLALCQHIGAEPWYVMPPTASGQDILNFMEYLAGTSGTFAARRAAQGQAAPWTTVFNRVHLEFGNELWGAGDPGDPFGGASHRGGVRLGQCADRFFAMLKTSPHYAGAAAVLDLVIGGQAGFAGRQQEIEANSNDHTSTALAPYFGELHDGWATDAQMFGPLFAKPFYDCLNAGGRMYQSHQHLQNGGNGTRMSIYEINYHTTSIIAGLPASTRNEFVAGASGAIALPLNMLLPMFEFGAIDQCAFTAVGYAFRFDTSGGWPPAQDQFVHIWGMLRDLYHYDLKRPTWLGVELANKAVMGDGITTTQTGDNPTWTQSAINGVGAATTVNFVQSFAFRQGNQYGIVLMNLDLVNQHGVRLYVPGTPAAGANLWRLEPGNIRDQNTTSATVNIQAGAITTFQNGFEMVLPRHSIRVITWTN